jgi:catechol 2,3-dioxygenase-like lactoylglutathione lyase family enzyme
MFSHIFIGVSDFERALRFYQPLMENLGIALRFCDADKPWAGWHSERGARPLFVIAKPHNEQAHHPGNGQMIAFLANSRQHVRDDYRIALANGATCEGPPGLRPQYHANYYGAYFRDPEGNKLCVACHSDETEISATF